MKIAIIGPNFDDLLGREYQNQAVLCLILYLLNIDSVVGGVLCSSGPLQNQKICVYGDIT